MAVGVVINENRSSSKVIYSFWPYWTDFQSYQPDWSSLSYISYFHMEANSDGTLDTGNIGPNYYNVRDAAHFHNVKVTITVKSFNQNTQDAILAHRQNEFVNNILHELQYYGADGVAMDFEAVRKTNSITNESNSVLMENFMRILYYKLKKANPDYHISFTVMNTVENVYRNTALSQYTDALFLMGYDYHWINDSKTGAVSPYDNINQPGVVNSVNILKNYYPINKIILGLPFFGYDWPSSSTEPGANTAGKGKFIQMKNAVENAKIYGRLWDANSRTPWYKYQSESVLHQVWYDDIESLGLKFDYVNSENIGGTGFWALGYEGKDVTIWNVVKEKFVIEHEVNKRKINSS